MTRLHVAMTRFLSFNMVVLLILALEAGSAPLSDARGLHENSALPSYANLSQDFSMTMPDSCLPDNYEPNDTRFQATTVNSSSQLSANFHSPSDVDWYRYNATSGHENYAVASYGGVPYLVEVYHEGTGQLVATNAGFFDASARWYSPTNASYLIKVSYPVQAIGLYACSFSTYYFQATGWPSDPSALYQVTGLVYHDSDWSGNWQIEETPITSVSIALRRLGGDVIAMRITGGDGTFRFTDVGPGAYIVEQSDLSGYISTSSNRVIIGGSRDSVVYFGDYYLPTRGSLQFLPLQIRE